MTTILLTAIGGDIAQAVASIIRDSFPDWTVIGADMGVRHGGGLFVEKLLQSPPASSPSYLDWLEDTLAAQDVDFCLPLSEPELEVIAAGRCGTIGKTSIVTPSFKAIEVGTDKLATSEFILGLGVPGPWTVAADHRAPPLRMPAIYKPRRGAGSKSIFVCKTDEEADFYRKYFPGGIFQELLTPADREVTCAVYRTRSGEIAVLQLLRTLAGGFTSWAQVISNIEIQNQCEIIANALDLRGSINIQLRITDAGPRIFEINPRFSSTTLLRHIAGFRDVVWTLQEAQGFVVAPTLPPEGLIGVRVQGAKILRPKNEDHERPDR